MNPNEVFSIDGEVRDSELDLQGIVNNANYFIFFAHARHKHLKALGIDFSKTHDEGHDLVLAEATIKFRTPLKSGDLYTVTSKLVPQGKIRAIMEQEVIRKSDSKVCCIGIFTVTSISTKTGRPEFPDSLKNLLGI
jgi:acyl-CoA thioester hydrolase